MNPKPISTARNPDLRRSADALTRAAERARQLAAQPGTTLVGSRNGVIEHVAPDHHAWLPEDQPTTVANTN